MGDMDNDFSDLYDLLYADVEVQASSAINSVPSITQLDLQEVDNKKESSGSGSKSVYSISEKNGEKEAIVDEGSDTEDDLNIVLNNSDDDSEERGEEEEENGGFGGSELNKNPKNVDQLEVVDGLQESFNGEAEKGDARKYGCHSQYKDQRRHGTVLSTNTLDSVSNKSNEKNGRAIHSEDGIGERQVHGNSKGPLDRDLDVIKIVGQDSRKDSSGSMKEGLGHMSSSEHKASKDGDFCADDSRGNICCSSAFEDELHSEHSRGSKSYGLQRKPVDCKHCVRHGSSVQEKGHQSFGVETDQYLSRYSDEGKYFLQQAISRAHYEVMAREWYRYVSGFAAQKENERGDRWKRKEEEDSHFRQKTKGYGFPREPRYRSDFTRGKYKRSPPYNSRNGDNFYARGKYKNPERNKRRYGSPSIREEDEFWKWRDRRSSSSRFYKEPYNANGRWIDKGSPRKCVYERLGRHDKYRTQSWSKRFENAHKSGRFGKLNDDRYVHQRRCNLMKEENRGNRFDRNSNVIRRGNHERTLQRRSDLVDSHLVVGEGKCTLQSPGRCSDAGSTMYKGKDKNIDSNIDLELKTLTSNENEVEENQNSEEWIDKFLAIQQKEALDIEEGQIIPEETSKSTMENIHTCDNAVQVSDAEELGDMDVEGYYDPLILEMMAKMENWKEQFEDPITLQMDPGTGMGTIPDAVADLYEETADINKQQRPARKRKWGESSGFSGIRNEAEASFLLD
ncbi:hypothetical protein LguiB_014729 [Lonicera macranthoides]